MIMGLTIVIKWRALHSNLIASSPHEAILAASYDPALNMHHHSKRVATMRASLNHRCDAIWYPATATTATRVATIRAYMTLVPDPWITASLIGLTESERLSHYCLHFKEISDWYVIVDWTLDQRPLASNTLANDVCALPCH